MIRSSPHSQRFGQGTGRTAIKLNDRGSFFFGL
jgi:hypothetical protein